MAPNSPLGQGRSFCLSGSLHWSCLSLSCSLFPWQQMPAVAAIPFPGVIRGASGGLPHCLAQECPPEAAFPEPPPALSHRPGSPVAWHLVGQSSPPASEHPRLRPKTLEAHPSGAESLQRSWHQTTYSLGDHNHKGWSWRAPSLPRVGPRGAAAAGRHRHVTRACARPAGGGPPAWTPHATLRRESSTHRGKSSCTTRRLWRWGRRDSAGLQDPSAHAWAGSAGTPTAGILGRGWAPGKLGQRFPSTCWSSPVLPPPAAAPF